MPQCHPYLSFFGNCREAMEFYAKVTGGEILAMSTYGDAPGDNPIPDHLRGQVMHSRIKIGNDLLMASDMIMGGGSTGHHGFDVSLHLDTPEEADCVFAALAEGGKVQFPLQENFFAHRFGSLHDKFGVPWMVICEKPMSG
ncbi:MAG TPA: VOC family protein [Caulobacteraceae bacterium]|jgi:PhnB protein